MKFLVMLGLSLSFALNLNLNAADVYGTPKDDVLKGTDESDVLVGHDGDDILYGFGGENHLFGGAGKDTYYHTSKKGTVNIIFDKACEINYLFCHLPEGHQCQKIPSGQDLEIACGFRGLLVSKVLIRNYYSSEQCPGDKYWVIRC